MCQWINCSLQNGQFYVRWNLPQFFFYKALENERKDSLITAAAAAKSLQSCPTLCYPIDGSPPGSPVPGILQAKTLDWVAISFSNAGKWKVKVKSFSRVRPSVTPWTAAHHAPPSMGFSRQEYWSGVPLPSLIVCLCYSNFLRICCEVTSIWSGLLVIISSTNLVSWLTIYSSFQYSTPSLKELKFSLHELSWVQWIWDSSKTPQIQLYSINIQSFFPSLSETS